MRNPHQATAHTAITINAIFKCFMLYRILLYIFGCFFMVILLKTTIATRHFRAGRNYFTTKTTSAKLL